MSRTMSHSAQNPTQLQPRRHSIFVRELASFAGFASLEASESDLKSRDSEESCGFDSHPQPIL